MSAPPQPDACAALVERADPDRFLATMAAPPEARARLWPLYAFNVEIARAPQASAEPMVALMRLQWWVDTVAGFGPDTLHPAHETAGPLARLVADTGLDTAPLVAMAEARRADVEPRPFGTEAELWAYLDATGGNLMTSAARLLGAAETAMPPIASFARGAALAAYLAAVPELMARGRNPLPDAAPEAIAALAREGLAQIAAARRNRALILKSIRPALWPGWQAKTFLARAAARPLLVVQGGLATSEFRRRASLLTRALFGSF